MTNRQLLILTAIVNIIIMFLLVHKQSIITKQLYQLQQLQEQKNALLEYHKELMLELHQVTQLSKIEDHAKTTLTMNPITLKDAHYIPDNKPQQQGV